MADTDYCGFALMACLCFLLLWHTSLDITKIPLFNVLNFSAKANKEFVLNFTIYSAYVMLYLVTESVYLGVSYIVSKE